MGVPFVVARSLTGRRATPRHFILERRSTPSPNILSPRSTERGPLFHAASALDIFCIKTQNTARFLIG